MKRAAFHNLGCKVNSYELDIMRQILRSEGYVEVSFQEKADVYVINTCTVTNIADRKSRQMLHRAKKQNPDAVVVAVGCYVETDPARVEKDPAVDLVVGNNKKTEIGNILREFLANREAGGGSPAEAEENYSRADDEGKSSGKTAGKILRGPKNYISLVPACLDDLTTAPEFEKMQLTEPGHTRAYIKIQDGCNQFCSYCIIPFARGRIRSREPQDILREVQGLVTVSGIREIVLTGIHVSSYGLDFPQDPADIRTDKRNDDRDTFRKDKQNDDRDTVRADNRKAVRFDPVRGGQALLSLLRQLSAIEGLERIRLGSLEPRIMTESFIQGIYSLPKVCPHFHLSLQSGCDATLRRMNRHYTTAEYAQSVAMLRKYYDRPAITTDVIVGFPGETEAEFADTCAFLEEIRFYEIHVFRYSRRSGTVAASMPVQIPEPVKAVRSDRLLGLTAAQAAAFRDQFVGEEEEILLEEICEYAGEQYWVGSTARYVPAAIPVGQVIETGPGSIVRGILTAREIPFSRGTAREMHLR